MNKVVYSRKSDHWATPHDFLAAITREFGPMIDPCPLHATFDGLAIKWNGRVFCNPPYSSIRPWLEKGIAELAAGHADLVVYLIPARTCTRWFHDLVYGKAEIQLHQGAHAVQRVNVQRAVPVNVGSVPIN